MSKRPWKITQSFKKNKFKLRKFNEPLTPIKRNKNWSSYQFEPYKENLINHQISEFPPSEKDKQIFLNNLTRVPGKVCCVCCSDEKESLELPCGHIICFECGNLYFQDKYECPVCRRSIIPGVEFYKNNNCGNYKKNEYLEYLNQKREREKQKKEEISERELKENENFKKIKIIEKITENEIKEIKNEPKIKENGYKELSTQIKEIKNEQEIKNQNIKDIEKKQKNEKQKELEKIYKLKDDNDKIFEEEKLEKDIEELKKKLENKKNILNEKIKKLEEENKEIEKERKKMKKK